MIENNVQLAATLDYIAKWADALEGMRRDEAARNGGVFSTLAAGPLNEIRTNLEVARAFARTEDAPPFPNDSHAADNFATAPAKQLTHI